MIAQRLIAGIEPTGGNAAIVPAFNVREQGVADDDGFAFIQIRDIGKAVIKEYRGRFWLACCFGYKHIQKVWLQAGTCDTVQLGGYVAVGGKVQPGSAGCKALQISSAPSMV